MRKLIVSLPLFFVLLIFDAAHAQRLVGGANPALPTNGTQVCSIMAQNGTPCTDAYSVTRQLVQGYNGPLFQVEKNGSPFTLCNIEQTASGTANYSPCVSSVCAGGVASGCLITQIYDQMNGNNNLRAFSNNLDVLVIDSITGLPWITNLGTAQYFITNAPGQDEKTSDTPANGAPAIGAARSVAYVGQPFNQDGCCGSFGWSHNASTPIGGIGYYGGAMEIDTGFGVNTIYNYGTAGYYNGVVDLEPGGGCGGTPNEYTPVNYTISTTQTDQLFIITWDGSSVMAGSNNGHVWTGSTSGCTDQGQYIHFAGGGDMSGIGIIFREGILTSGAMNSTAQAEYLSNVQAFYSQLTFN